MRLLLLAALLLLPGASAAVAFDITLADARADVVTEEREPVAYARADIVSFTSSDEGDRIVQRIEMAATPAPPADSILVRSWFHDSTNGTFFVVDMEVRGDSAQIEHRFRPVVRRGSFYNTSAVDARWGVDGTTWVFDFDARAVADATCFDPGVFSEHTPTEGGDTGFDSVYPAGPRRCRTAAEPNTPPPPVQVSMPAGTNAAPADAPGSGTPTPGAGAALAVASLAMLAITRRRSARKR